MRKILPLIALTLILTACGGSKIVSFKVTFDTKDETRVTELKAAIGRDIEGRLAAKKQTLSKLTTRQDGDALLVVAAVSDDEAVQLLKTGLTTPLTMSVMKEVGAGQGDIVSEKYGEFKETGIETKHFDWVTAGSVSTDTGVTKGSVLLQFTKDGQTQLKKVFAANKGSVIAIFMRGQLMSKKLVDAKDKDQPSIAIDGIPNAELAAAFADDVNVGLHTTFTALP